MRIWREMNREMGVEWIVDWSRKNPSSSLIKERKEVKGGYVAADGIMRRASSNAEGF